MAIVGNYGPVDRDHECDHPSRCGRDAVAQIPEANVIGGFRYCDFHLALWADTKGDWETLQDLGVARLAADDRCLSLEAVPPEIQREVRYRRIGVDHRGLAHYHVAGRRDQDGDRVITVDARLDFVDAYEIPGHVGLEGWVEHVLDRRGWVELEDRFSSSGGESA